MIPFTAALAPTAFNRSNFEGSLATDIDLSTFAASETPLAPAVCVPRDEAETVEAGGTLPTWAGPTGLTLEAPFDPVATRGTAFPWLADTVTVRVGIPELTLVVTPLEPAATTGTFSHATAVGDAEVSFDSTAAARVAVFEELMSLEPCGMNLVSAATMRSLG